MTMRATEGHAQAVQFARAEFGPSLDERAD
jgi:hypothetical protein